ncbi:MAG: hypothetical protein FWH38_08320, partial [Treponema sp.]|nr:hypothetical protein [Treponema sp.]
RCGGGGCNAQAGAFPLAFFRGGVKNGPDRETGRNGGGGKSRNIFIGVNQENFLKTTNTADQIQGMGGQGLPAKGFKQLVPGPITVGKT